jgi:protein-disulfide isomerase
MNAFNSLTDQQKQGVVIGGVIGLAIVVVLVAILLSGGAAEGTGLDFTSGNLGVDGVTVEMGRTADGGHFIGSPNAPVTIVAFEDFLCPHCQTYKPTVNRIIEELVMTGKAKFEFRFLPTQGARSIYAFALAECAGEMVEGGFWVAHDELFASASSGGTSETALRTSITDNLSISAAELIECTTQANQVNVDQRLAQQNGISSTPSLRIRYGDDGTLQLINNSASAPTYEAIAATVELVSGGLLGG